MKLMWIGGSHPRHLYYINQVRQAFPLAGAVLEKREHLIPSPPEGVDPVDRDNFVRHFQDRAEAEAAYFGNQQPPSENVLEVSEQDLNSEATAGFVESIGPDVVLVFGCGLIKGPLYEVLPRHTVNLHLGLSPRYRGAATLFWPFYFLEPPYAGTTFHYIVAEPDAGDVIHQVVPELRREDGIHDVACRAVQASASEAVGLLRVFEREGGWTVHRQQATGKNFLASDFKPEHLRMIYNVYDNNMVAHFLDGKLRSKTPKLFRQF